MVKVLFGLGEHACCLTKTKEKKIHQSMLDHPLGGGIIKAQVLSLGPSILDGLNLLEVLLDPG